MLSAFTAGETAAGHESTFYPSFYPQELRIETVDAGSAAARLRGGSLHAYVGGDPFAGGALAAGVGSVPSLGSYLVVTVNPASGSSAGAKTRCARITRVVRGLAATKTGYTFHPYPVTPHDADYLQHGDLVEAAKEKYRANSGRDSSAPRLRVRADGALARSLVRPRWQPAGKDWDVTVEEVDAAALMASRRASLNGWLGPPWIKAGWFHAYLLLAGAVSDESARRPIDATYQRLVTGGYSGMVERLNLERRLVSLLTAGCERAVAGYTVKREAFNSDYSAGVENIAADSVTGFNSPVFIRTVKLKDFPWNGWLRVGIERRASAAWNPVAGFTDAPGSLIWAAMGDPAFLPAPHSAGWIPNRVTSTLTTPGSAPASIQMPEDALMPEPGSGSVRPVGPGKTAKAKVVYRVLMSAFHDGTRMSVADLIYPFIFSYRWGAKGAATGEEYDPVIDESTALAREWLAGLRVLGVETVVKSFGEDLTFTYEVPVVEVYLTHVSSNPEEVASVVPPWSAVPWHVTVLMEEAVRRGLGAFSADEARRRGAPWLDLARGRALDESLAPLVEEFRAQGYVPGALARFATADEARHRWAALKRFYDTNGHFLVTNGPYRLEKWSSDSVTLQVFRDPSYPLGVGSFDRYAIPRRAYASKIVDRGDRLEILADVEKVMRFQRSYEVAREPLRAASAADEAHDVPVCRYVIVGPGRGVIAEGVAQRSDGGAFIVDLKGRLGPGRYTVMIALDRHRVGGGA
ncbi:MAG: hypothetical protein DMD82_10425 [Candidatus Rokuibacteriota bacterium]|nr:MAG: hypothetical protein DMD82_10425 [Candidatus Rokubacteria bacterium]